MKLKNILLTGLLGLTIGCTSTKGIRTEMYDPVFIWVSKDENVFTLGYDTDKDNYEDTIFYYTCVGGDDEQVIFGKLLAIQVDRNRNHIFEKDEFIYKIKDSDLENKIKLE